jgi:hypothetical protein
MYLQYPYKGVQSSGNYIIGVYDTKENAIKATSNYFIEQINRLKEKNKKLIDDAMQLLKDKDYTLAQLHFCEFILNGWYKLLPIELNQQVHYETGVTSFHPTDSDWISIEDLKKYL